MPEHVYECVPNISEGRDASTIDACEAAVVKAGVTLAHRTSDPAHNRSVLTYFGRRETLLDAAVALAETTAERIDLRGHSGVHPRMGALDVLPFVPLGAATLGDAARLAHEAGRRIWDSAGVPVYYYGAAALRSERRHLPSVRRGGFEALARRYETGDAPDVGDVPAHFRAGAVAVGARNPLVAFNVVLESNDLSLAKRIAARIRESGGGLRTLRALGLDIGASRVQVSCNVTDPDAVPLDRIVELVRRMAAREGVELAASELIGLAPRHALLWVAARRLGIDVTRLRGERP